MKHILKAFTGITYCVVYIILPILGSNAQENSIVCHETSPSFLSNNATNIQASVVVQSLQLDDVNMEMRAYVTIKLSWEANENLLTPSMHFSNAIDTKSHHHVLTTHGDEKFSSEKSYSLRLPCQLNFNYFPFDFQLCNMDLLLTNSNGCKNNNLKIKWLNESIKINNKIKFKNYFLKAYGTNDSSPTELESSPYNRLEIIFFWERFYTSHIMRIILPCAILVVISWLTLWISEKPQTALRLSMELMTILITSITVASYNGTVPSVGYIKAVDVWTGTCLAFTSITLVYSIVLHFIINFKTPEKRLHSSTNKKYEESADELEKNLNPRNSEDSCILKAQNKIKDMFSVPSGVDQLFRILYLTLFISFVLYFWKTISNASTIMETEYLKSAQTSNSNLFF